MINVQTVLGTESPMSAFINKGKKLLLKWQWNTYNVVIEWIHRQSSTNTKNAYLYQVHYSKPFEILISGKLLHVLNHSDITLLIYRCCHWERPLILTFTQYIDLPCPFSKFLTLFCNYRQGSKKLIWCKIKSSSRETCNTCAKNLKK